MLVEESIVINSNLNKVYEAFLDLEYWQEILPDVLDVKILYDDGQNQEFLMTVDRPTGNETIRGIRYCFNNSSLELFQPVPPPGVKKMVGKWNFIDKKDAVIVNAKRNFELMSSDKNDNIGEKTEAFAKKLRNYLSTNLELFKNAIEKG